MLEPAPATRLAGTLGADGVPTPVLHDPELALGEVLRGISGSRTHRSALRRLEMKEKEAGQGEAGDGRGGDAHGALCDVKL